MENLWRPGEIIAGRGIVNGKVWSAKSLIVVQDTREEKVLLLLPGAECALTEGYFRWRYGDYSLGTRWQEARGNSWKLRTFPWETNRFLILLEPPKYYACFLIWDQATDQFKCYYINFQLPYRRSHCGYDSLDLDLDLVIDPQLNWKWKDEADYQEAIREGGIRADWVKAIEETQSEIFDKLQKRCYPFDGTWLDWRPDPSWSPPRLPDRWEVV